MYFLTISIVFLGDLSIDWQDLAAIVLLHLPVVAICADRNEFLSTQLSSLSMELLWFLLNSHSSTGHPMRIVYLLATVATRALQVSLLLLLLSNLVTVVHRLLSLLQLLVCGR